MRDYSEIFDQRGKDYHEAMTRFPRAREAEFKKMLSLAGLQDGDIVCDYPSGGGYMKNFVYEKIDLICLESSRTFLECTNSKALLVENDAIPLESSSVDVFLSLAGIHHKSDKKKFFSDIFRCLKSGGKYIIADVQKYSEPAEFLNVFVHNHSTFGHEGIFLDDSTINDLQSCGFDPIHIEKNLVPWKFSSIDNMIKYCQLLFGIDKATPDEIESGIEKYLGTYLENHFMICMNWNLGFITARKL